MKITGKQVINRRVSIDIPPQEVLTLLRQELTDRFNAKLEKAQLFPADLRPGRYGVFYEKNGELWGHASEDRHPRETEWDHRIPAAAKPYPMLQAIRSLNYLEAHLKASA